jgi:uncharacterized phiE125 gp8 family phage protein
MITRDAVVLDGAMLDEAKAYLRLETDEEDAPLSAIILAAIGHAEAFLNQMLIRRAVRQILPVSADWQRLAATPVAAITSAAGIPAEGARFQLSPPAYAIDIDSNSDGWLRVMQPGSAGRVEVAYSAGLALDWAALPETIRLGVLRLIGHLHAHRDAADDVGPPAAVAALLRPWRRMRLS